MEPKSKSTSNEIRQHVELILSHWKSLLLCLLVAVLLGFTYLRYATNIYSASTTIKIQDEKQSQKLPSIQEISSDGLFSDGTNKIKDEIEIIKSRTLIENVVKNLKLNIRCFAVGSIKENEIYRNPPIKVSFFNSDSVINKIDTTLHIKVKSTTEFLAFKDEGKSLIDRNDSEGKSYDFGAKIETSFGGITLTPGTGKHAPVVGSNLKIVISSVSSMVNSYQRSIALSTETGSSIVKLELKETNSHKAVDILNELVNEYNKDVLFDKEAVIKVTSDFITKRLEAVSQELEKVEGTAEQLQKSRNITSLGTQTDLNLQSEKNLQNEILKTSNNIQLISYLQEELDADERMSDMLPSDLGIGDSNTAQVITSHNELVAQRDRILRNSSESNPVVIQLNNQINSLKSNLRASLINIKQTSNLTLNSLNKENARVRGRLYTAPTKAREIRGIERQQGIKESLFLYLLEKREESAISLGMYSPSAKIIDRAYSSHKPIAPTGMIIYLASILFGLGLPIGLIYVSDMLDTKLYRKEDLVNILDIPYLGDIPKTSKKQKLVKKVDYSPMAEAYRIIRSNIDFMMKGVKGKPKKLFITSTKAQEGKSHTSTNLASSISFSEKSVLLIEMDIRVPKIMKYLGLKDKTEKGLTDYIIDDSIKPEDVVVKHPDNEFLDIIPSGTIPPNPSELLMSDRVEQLFNYFNNKYDYIIADTSAVGLVSDTLLISKYADMFIYVVSADGVDGRQLGHVAQTLFDEKRLPNMTMLLNGVKVGKKGYGYGYGYGENPGKKKKWYNFFS